MDDLTGRVAVITGGASGIGLAFARRFATAGMKVVLADIEIPILDDAVAGLQESGADALGIQCDVSNPDSVSELALRVDEVHGATHVLCLNAGVAHSAPLVEQSLADWKWVLGVNLMGIVHGLDSFLAKMTAQNEGHIVISAAVAGHTAYPGIGPYSASKHAAIAIAETLHNELLSSGSQVRVTALCPSFVNTQIIDSGRNRPEHLTNPLADTPTAEEIATRDAVREMLATEAHSPSSVADLVYDAMLSGSFWVFTDDQCSEAIARRNEEVLQRMNPSSLISLFEESDSRESQH